METAAMAISIFLHQVGTVVWLGHMFVMNMIVMPAGASVALQCSLCQ